jgi:hypothetical protein
MKRAVLLMMLSAVACGGKVDDVIPDAGSDGEVAPDATPPPPLDPGCPAAQPTDGTACAKEGLECEYGPDPRWTCNWVASCYQGRWSVTTTNDAWCPTPSENPAACPGSFTEASQAGVCDAPGTPCQYAEGWCSCMFFGGPPLPDGGGQDYSWQCGFGLATGCPASRPRLGTSCTAPDLDCEYSACDQPSGLSVRCDVSTHTWAEGFGSVCAGASN